MPPGELGTGFGKKPDDLRAGIFAFSPTRNPGFGRVGTAMMRGPGSCPRRDSTRSGAAIFRAATRGWHERDDKWAFPRSVLDEHRQRRWRRSAALWTARHRRTVLPPPVARGCSAAGACAIVDRFDSRTFSSGEAPTIRRLKAASSFASSGRRVAGLCATTRRRRSPRAAMP